MKSLISVVAPMYNEESLVDLYVEETISVLKQLSDSYSFEILLVNDGSKDSTLDKMVAIQNKNPWNISIVNLTRNFGLEGAVNAGLRKASGDAVVVMDADLQDPPAVILEMVKKWEAGADIVVGSRIERKYDSFFKRITANIYYKILDSLSEKLKLERNSANYRLISRKAVDVLLSLPEVNTYFRVNVPFIGMKSDRVEYSRVERASGKTKYNLSTLVRCALDGLTSISIEPLRKISLLVPSCFFISVASILLIILRSDFWRIFGVMVLVVSFFSCITFTILAILAEYIGQIMREVRHRPTSLIYEYKPAKVIGERE